MKEIGGYFELELAKGKEYYRNLYKLNSATNCLKIILDIRKYQKIYLPYYICEIVSKSIKKKNIEIEYYHIDQNFDIINNINLKSNEAIYLVNYFGIKGKAVEKYIKKYNYVILDNAQAFFHPPPKHIDTIYSPRKYFGVPDGGYLHLNGSNEIELKLDQEISYQNIEHLTKRLELSAEQGYFDFKANEERLTTSNPKLMSKLTECLLSSIDYRNVRKQRSTNFNFLHSLLGKYNEISIDLDNNDIPMVYPFYIDSEGLRDFLIKNKVYIALYWPNVLLDKDKQEYKIANNLLALPIDQRYSTEDMGRIISLIEKYINKNEKK